MRISDTTIEKILTSSGLIAAEQIDALKQEAIDLKSSIQEVVLKKKITDETTLTKAFAQYLQIPYIELTPREIPVDVLNKIPEQVARQYRAVLFKIDPDGTNHLAMDDPDDIQAVNFLEKEIGANTKIYIATSQNIVAALEAYHSNVNDELDKVMDIAIQPDNSQNEKVSTADIDEKSPIAKTVNILLEYAIRSNTSDIHIEPRENFVQIRYRIDGILKEVNRLPKNVLSALISRIKILSNLKIDEHRIPQDGRFKINVAGKQYALRVSTLPVADGEKLVMRILDESNQAVRLESLGPWGQPLKLLKEAITSPNGMVLVTGPTGSGKSTSLFSILSSLNTPSVNISTIEDPVEYRIPGVNQTQTNDKAGMTFANGLRSLLRQDPNIIMVGEVRDSETADLSVQAALTGHLVFSTLHTNDAATCLPRLLDMGIEPFLIASTIRVVVGQRLVRCLNKKTRKLYQPTEQEKQMIVKLFKLKPGQNFSYIHELEKQAAAEGIGGDTPLGTDENGIKNLWLADKDDNINGATAGYLSRVGIYEVLHNSVNIQKLIMNNATSNQIQEQAVAEGMITMQADGLIKALRGETTIEEIIRATKE
jgi:type IV pilus assembly protein PilB